jgi:hypothetical protein
LCEVNANLGERAAPIVVRKANVIGQLPQRSSALRSKLPLMAKLGVQ